METRFLETFVAIVDHGSIAAAARRLNITPAAVALRIRTLENEMGVTLLRRSGRTVRVTSEGSALLPQIRSFVGEMQELVDSIAGRPTGELRFGATTSGRAGLVPLLIAAFSRKHPQIVVHVSSGNSSDVYRDLLDGEIDVGLMLEPPFGIPKSCDWAPMRQVPLQLLTTSAKSVTDPIEALGTLPFIRMDRRRWAGRVVDSYVQQLQLKPYVVLEADSVETIAVLVADGRGISLVPNWISHLPSGVTALKLPRKPPPPVYNIGLMWLRASPRAEFAQILAKP